ncbi:hypothetical protein OE88DRAFT_1809608 [Heliocybe sulcata]|uniref:Rhodopsin domain-containing protein n=1 Tax=Heliocybe sulcata TaxID=5364 RepID=A0A5C3MYM3_9AGAM|nr:hypothetical protein OE88DRAFT_1809608 [Heliocybe sulcata]
MPITATDVRIAVTIVHPIAILSTAFRLVYRWRRKRFWWDDGMAGISMICCLIFLVAIWIRTDSPGVGPLDEPPGARIVSYWFVSLAFTMILWSARMSILLSIVRIVPPMFHMRIIMNALLVIFPAIWVALLIQKIYRCAYNTSWTHSPSLQCHLGKDVAITELCTDIFADVTLVTIPLRLLWNVRIPKNQRKLLYTIFCTSIITTIVSIPHAIYVMGIAGLYEGITAHIEAGVSLIVANLLVITTFLYAFFRNGESIESTDPYTQGTMPSMPIQIQRHSRSTFPDSFDLKFFSFSRGRTSEGTDPAELAPDEPTHKTRPTPVALSTIDDEERVRHDDEEDVLGSPSTKLDSKRSI